MPIPALIAVIIGSGMVEGVTAVLVFTMILMAIAACATAAAILYPGLLWIASLPILA